MSGFLLQHYLDHSAARYHQKIAVTDGHSSLTFDELSAASDHLANALVSQGVNHGDRVVYFLKRSPNCIISTLGILKAGAAYVPLDIKTPQERWNHIILDTSSRFIICDLSTLNNALEWSDSLNIDLKIICFGSHQEMNGNSKRIIFLNNCERVTGLSNQINADPDDVAYVLYTSGSTGDPKGVMVTHNNVKNYIDWAVDYFHIISNDHILSTAPFSFDMSTFDIFGGLAAGTTISIATDENLLFPEKLVRFIEQEEVTIWKGVSSLLMYMCRAGVVRSGRMPQLKTIIFAGESFDAKYLRQYMNAFPEKGFFNGYGPTEATGVSFCHKVLHAPEPGQTIPIGKPCKGAKAILVDDNNELVEPGELGELCIAGVCLAKGYLNDPEKTRTLFTSPPKGCNVGDRVYHTGDLCRQMPDGDYVFVSRKDLQVKVDGIPHRT